MKIIEDSWTEKQRYTIWDMMIHQGSQEMCAEMNGYNSVNGCKETGGWKVYHLPKNNGSY